MKTKSKIILAVIFLALISIIVYSILKNNQEVIFNNQVIPKGNTHWHPNIKIIINNQSITIPNNIGVGTGKIIDLPLSGMGMSPTHTHESDGTIHIENKNPSLKPETLTLGYFFDVWDKRFDQNCIFDYCSNNGTLKMYVNEKENFEFRDYIMHDKDKIIIEYSSN
ncbi:hypothetical protein J4216_05440 [Candidatus Woesearchaeota archaeon]|nr:hypothetical protein [Candidatus Woesearchaeota archaeon]